LRGAAKLEKMVTRKGEINILKKNGGFEENSATRPSFPNNCFFFYNNMTELCKK
jgi:hypothetical protein